MLLDLQLVPSRLSTQQESVTKLQLAGLSGQVACRKTGSFIFSFKKCELIKIVPSGYEFYEVNLNVA